MFKSVGIFYQKKKRGLKALLSLYNQEPKYALRVISKRVLKSLYFLSIPYLILFLPFLLFIRLLKPFFLIRLGALESEGIGHFTLPVEIYLAEIECNVHQNTNVLDVWYLGSKICNETLKEKWKEHLLVFPRILLLPIDKLNKIIPGGKSHCIPYRRIEDTNYASPYVKNPWQAVDIYDVISKTRPRIKITKDERVDCIRNLNEIGFDPSKKYVCFNVRDSSYHRDSNLFEHRNGSINDYHIVFNYLNELGYQVIRLGSSVQEKLTLEGPLIFDYASSDVRSDLIDLFLISECSFSVGTGCGLDCASVLFRKMHAFIDIVQIGTIPDFAHGSIIIFKKFLEDGKEISLKQIRDKGFMSYTLASQYKEKNITFKENTSKQIKEILWEMHSRVNKTWETLPEHHINQEKFRGLFSIDAPTSGITALIGSEFIKTVID